MQQDKIACQEIVHGAKVRLYILWCVYYCVALLCFNRRKMFGQQTTCTL